MYSRIVQLSQNQSSGFRDVKKTTYLNKNYFLCGEDLEQYEDDISILLVKKFLEKLDVYI